jgi:hypothetical protein
VRGRREEERYLEVGLVSREARLVISPVGLFKAEREQNRPPEAGSSRDNIRENKFREENEEVNPAGGGSVSELDNCEADRLRVLPGAPFGLRKKPLNLFMSLWVSLVCF